MTKFNLPVQEINVDSKPFEYRKAKKTFSQLGFATFLAVLLPTVVQIIVTAIWKDEIKNLLTYPWFVWIFALAPIYIVGVPIFLSLVKKIPTYTLQKKKLNATTFTQLCFICFAFMNIGSAVTNLVLYLIQALSGQQPSNALTEVMGSSDMIYNLIATVIFAPIIEEFIFRKVLIDRTVKYGEKIAVIMSALFFSMFHANIFQLIYTFALGYVLAFIYVKTGNIKYPILIHAITNFLYGNFIPILSGYQFLLASIISSILGITGLVLLIKRRKIFSFSKGETVIPKGKTFTVSVLNIGFILFFLSVCLVSYMNLF